MADERVGVIGLGYVGLPLAVAFAEVGLEVIGVDVDAGKVAMLMVGRSPIRDVPEEALRAALESGRFRATTDYGALAGVEAVLICVPTPYDAMRAPDLSYVRAAAEGLVPHLRRGHLVILQSTTYPGTTEEVVRPILERGGLRAGEDFDLAFSPERIDPGNREWTVRNTPKVVGGITPRSTARAAALLERLGAPVYRVSSPRVAEMSKLLENIFRSVNIALVNELALLCERMGIDIWEVIEAAKTKPFGFMAFYPGPGVGGHCIPVDPYYLSWKAREYDFYTKFIELAAEVNQGMPFHVVEKVEEALDRYERRGLRGARVLVLGVAFKREVDDARNSPAERIMELLLARGAEVAYHDPYVPRFRAGGSRFYREIVEWESVPLEEGWLRWADVVLIVTGHRAVDYPKVVATARLVVDTCNATAGIPSGSARIVRLGAPWPDAH
ncbi:nucleotide sugar dehydrogenase [Thermoflexus hugenholtzii]|uniref:UDP-N-acetyl-D-glucosamine dehydrogenase n=1 Tax=Thermoflexus hugenholtzii JAD2 TaxID=877466 RepID=A0A212RU35_9CHLR|nr:nucleotide sugar dehydrogenase [Thermoflexus hugenholtzii]SNB76133.1 UDP-N-acetyl-D-glucosamine dehydrogenase [Thermoflexus hugenholtzii JAD2]